MIFHYDDQNEDYLTIESANGLVDLIFNNNDSEQSPSCQLRDPVWLAGWLQRVLVKLKRREDDQVRIYDESQEGEFRDSICLSTNGPSLDLEFTFFESHSTDPIPFVTLKISQVKQIIKDLMTINREVLDA